MPSATIKLFLVHGDPKRLRTAELSNWTGKAIAGPRSEIEGLISREESSKPGVYFLTGTDPESGKAAAYIGEAESVRERIKGHADKDYWNHLTYVTSKDENLTKAHIRYLEGRLIEQARAAGRAEVMNSQTSGAKLPESDREDMEVFLEKIHQLLPVLGVEVLVPTLALTGNTKGVKIYTCDIKGQRATGYRSANGFVVRKDSQAVLNERDSAKKYPWPIELRNALKEDGTLIQDGDRLVFSKDAEFSSPSAAAAVIHGGHTNGLISWKDDQGKTLKEVESQTGS